MNFNTITLRQDYPLYKAGEKVTAICLKQIVYGGNLFDLNYWNGRLVLSGALGMEVKSYDVDSLLEIADNHRTTNH